MAFRHGPVGWRLGWEVLEQVIVLLLQPQVRGSPHSGANDSPQRIPSMRFGGADQQREVHHLLTRGRLEQGVGGVSDD